MIEKKNRSRTRSRTGVRNIIIIRFKIQDSFFLHYLYH